MTEHVPEFSPDETTVQFSHFVILLPRQEKLARRLKETALGNTVKLIDTGLAETNLPPVIDTITFEATHPAPSEEVPVFSGSIELSIDSVIDFASQKDVAWDAEYLSNLATNFAANNYITDRVAHDINTLHVRLDQEYAASVKLVSSLTECSVALKLERIDELETALVEMSAAPPDEPSDSVAIAQHFITALNLAIDTAVATFEAPTTEVYTLKFLPAISAEEKARLAERALAFSELDIPAHEILAHPQGLSDLAGVFAPKAELMSIAERYNDKYASDLFDLKPSHFLLYGPTGTGKSSLVEAFAKSINAKLTVVPSPSVPQKYTRESSANLENIFANAFKDKVPQVLFFDEFDMIGSTKIAVTSPHAETRKRLQELIAETTARHPEIIIAAATTANLDDIEPALSRPDRLFPIRVEMPTPEERLDILASLVSDQKSLDMEFSTLDYQSLVSNDPPIIYDNDINCVELADGTEGFSVADITVALETARNAAYERYKSSKIIGSATHEDILAAIEKLRNR